MKTHAHLASLALFVLAFSLATNLQIWFDGWEGGRMRAGSVLSAVLGDSKRMFALHFYLKGDAYFHSGYYPTIFDNNEAFRTPHMAEDAGVAEGRNTGDEDDFLGKPRDWIDHFNRCLFPSKHTHLNEGGPTGGGGGRESEILPWLRLSAELDPQHVESYLVAAYWLRERSNKTDEAEQFLREGLRENPTSYEILLELGRLQLEARKKPALAVVLFGRALDVWHKTQSTAPNPDMLMYRSIVRYLSQAHEAQGDLESALAVLLTAKSKEPETHVFDLRIGALERKRAGSPTKSP